MITAKIQEVDTSKTTLKVKLLTIDGNLIDCWVKDQLVNKILSDKKYALEYTEFEVVKSDGHMWIMGIS